MGGLALAGAISGMGQGLERGLQQITGGLIQQGLSDADRKFQSEKLALQMEQAERLNAATLASQKEIAGMNIGSHERVVDKQIGSQEKTTDKQIASNEAMTGMKLTEEEYLTERKLKSDEALTKQKIKADKEIHKWSNDVAREGHTTSMRVASLNAAKAYVDTLSDEETKLSVELNKVMSDPNSSIYKEIQLKLQKIQREKEYYGGVLAQASGRPPLEDKPAVKPAIKLPNLGYTKPGGLVQQPGATLTPGKTMGELYGK